MSRQALEDDGPLDSLTRETLLYCWGFCAALSGHHRSEDQVLFPQLSQAHPDLVPVIRQLTQDHNMIGHLIGQLERSLDSVTTT
ncbi:MAG TPA: hemerythrin domain-containing protein, partial [Pseudonocardiaceae bacterium]|nr:hemerythrin domain-containing protein [Pseudonocardiaceae bacterium]